MEETLLDFPHFHATLASQLFHCVPPFYFANRFKCFMANGKKFITANLQVNLWFGGKSRFCMGWASWRLGTNSGDTQWNHSGNTKVSSDFPRCFSKNESPWIMYATETEQNAFPQHLPVRLSRPPQRPTGQPTICPSFGWESYINQNASPNMFSFASSHPKVKCWYMLRTMEYLLLACLLQASSRSEPNLCTYMFRQKKNVEKYIKIVGYSFPMFSQNT